MVKHKQINVQNNITIVGCDISKKLELSPHIERIMRTNCIKGLETHLREVHKKHNYNVRNIWYESHLGVLFINEIKKIAAYILDINQYTSSICSSSRFIPRFDYSDIKSGCVVGAYRNHRGEFTLPILDFNNFTCDDGYYSGTKNIHNPELSIDRILGLETYADKVVVRVDSSSLHPPKYKTKRYTFKI